MRERMTFFRATRTVDHRTVIDRVPCYLDSVDTTVSVIDHVTMRVTVMWESYRDKYGFVDYSKSDFTFQMSLESLRAKYKGLSDWELSDRLIRERYPSIMMGG